MPRKISNSINDLILFVLYSFGEGKSSFEKLVKECFNQFPQVFSLKGHPQWPDTRKLDRPLRDLRKKKLIKGNPQTFFTLTTLGKRRAKEIAETFKQRKLL
ncbi:hypothetical protein KJA17_02130 [Patescibacteria group bacterium]|nr:hypothetical protein [Patescibacteria group bacterium]